MTLATINPSPATMKGRHEVSGVRNTSITSRGCVIAAFVALPLVGATAATAAPAPSETSKAYATQQQSYLDGLERAAREGATAADAARAAFAAQQQSYVEHLARAARESRSDAAGAPSVPATVADDTGESVSVTAATLLALGGIALGTGATVASRRLPLPQYRRGTV